MGPETAIAASGQLACAILLAASALPLCGQTPSASPVTLPSAADLVRDVVYNEVHDRERDSHWEYRSERSTAGQTLVREQVETASGPIFRIVEQNGAPLDAAQSEREDQRLDAYIHDPAEVARIAQQHQQDEDRLNTALQLFPQAVVCQYLGAPSGDTVQLSFQPNPAFVPNSFEARVIHALTGTVTLNLRLKRLIEIHGVVASRVDFGYGILGHVEKGGTFEIHRRQVSPTRWKTDLVNVHLDGRVLLLKTFNKEQREARTGFRPVPAGTTLADAKQMLEQEPGQSVEARLVPAVAKR